MTASMMKTMITMILDIDDVKDDTNDNNDHKNTSESSTSSTSTQCNNESCSKHSSQTYHDGQLHILKSFTFILYGYFPNIINFILVFLLILEFDINQIFYLA